MATAGGLKLRVILDDVNAEKICLPSRPETINSLIQELKDKLSLTFDFRLQYEDPEFDNALCNLVNIEDLPSKASVKIVKVIDLDLSSTSTDDTMLLSDATSPERLSRWPQVFQVPAFSYEVEFALTMGNGVYEKEGKTMNMNKDQKHNILDVMAAEMYKHKAYPSSKEIAKAAEALVKKHPCLKEKGSESGYAAWTNSLRFKMGNYRTKLSRAGIKDVAVNAGKRSRGNPEGVAARANIKRARRGEINFLPNFPRGESEETLEAQRQAMVEEYTKKDKDIMFINQQMQRTFALRREEIINSGPPIAELKSRWPALFAEAQLYQEFHRITNLSLPYFFFAALDKHTPQLLRLYQQRRTGALREKMGEILTAYEEQDENDICVARTAALVGLPVYLKEDSSEVFKTCKEDNLEFGNGAVALVAVVDQHEEIAAAVVPFKPIHVLVVLEDEVVMTVKSWPDALVVLYSLMYALHLSYPKKLRGFFDFIQMVFLNLEDGSKQLAPKLQALKNELE